MPEYSIAYVKFFINAAARVMNMHTGQTYGIRSGGSVLAGCSPISRAKFQRRT